MNARTVAVGTALAIFGLGAAVGIGLAANSISGDSVGLSEEPLSASGTLAPRPGTAGDERRQARARRRAAARRQERPQRQPAETTPAETAPAAPTETTEAPVPTTVPEFDSDSSGQGRGRGRGRGRSGGDSGSSDNSGSGSDD